MTPPAPHLQRAEVLLAQRRYDLAEAEARQAIAHEPENPLPYAYLALCLAERQQWRPAEEAAQRAIALDPADAFHHYVLARVYQDRRLYREAHAAIDEAIRLDPGNPDHWAVLAGLHAAQKRFRDALAAAERGLEHDAEHEACVNLRAIALTNLGDRAAATQAIDATLERNPLNPTSHANMGWTLLHQGQPRRAAEHFREALRLDPTSDWARSGIVEAMKARSPIYRVFLAYFLFMSRLSSGAQWGILIGGYAGYQTVRTIGRTHPALAPYLQPLIVAYVAFALGTIVAIPLFNLLLFTDRFGRHALTTAQRWGAASFGLSLLPPLVFLVLWVATADRAYSVCALAAGVLTIPVALAGLVSDRGRWTMIGLAAALAAACVAICAARITGRLAPPWLGLYALACFGSTWLANSFLTASDRPRG